MKCPQCNGPDLVMSDRQGVEIDYCPQCRGVWLNRGELDKIIERSTQYDARRRDDDDDDDDRRYAPPPPQQPFPGARYPQPGPYPQQPYYKKKKSFWSEIFD